MKEHILAVCIGYFLDKCLGDPHGIWHPVQGIGLLINWIEKILWKVFDLPEEKESGKFRKRIAGGILVVLVIAIPMATTIGLLVGFGKIHPWLKLGLECLMCYQMLALKSLRDESMKVYAAFMQENTSEAKRLESARDAVAMIVGRDTQNLSKEDVIKATVETIAENVSDGVIAPLFYMVIFGPLGGLLYKIINTMDSMIAYKNDRYRYFGTVAARLDDVVNFIPSRLAALFMIMACYVTGLDGKNAWKIYRRDRYNHASPNSAQTESVCAGALNVELAGNAYYFGKLYEKQTIGDANRKIAIDDIQLANQLVTVASNLMFVVCIVIMMTIYIKFL